MQHRLLSFDSPGSPSTGKLVINVDGASRGNPGPAAIGVTIKDDKGKIIATISQAIGRHTNNQAEYRAIVAALEKATDMKAKAVLVKSDSELMVKQISGIYRVKNEALKPLFDRAQQLISGCDSFSITHIPRELNSEADALANRALDALK
jgi:ribonuclease HI